jgi:hypothetical protein
LFTFGRCLGPSGEKQAHVAVGQRALEKGKGALLPHEHDEKRHKKTLPANALPCIGGRSYQRDAHEASLIAREK